jgi:hypothetical protein
MAVFSEAVVISVIEVLRRVNMIRNAQFYCAVIVSVAAASLYGCASKPIQATYVPVTDYQSLDCAALRAEYARIDSYLRHGVDQPQSVFSGVGFGIGAIGGSGFGWSPRVMFSAGQSSSGTHAVYARLLGQRDAVSQQAQLKGCSIVVAAAQK